MPLPMLGVSVSTPSQSMPSPSSGTVIATPVGGVNRSSGSSPSAMGSSRVRVRSSAVSAKTWIGGSAPGSAMLPTGPSVSMTRASPAGVPVKTLPARSVPETCSRAVPEGSSALIVKLPR
jgi:hypothetical protein